MQGQCRGESGVACDQKDGGGGIGCPGGAQSLDFAHHPGRHGWGRGLPQGESSCGPQRGAKEENGNHGWRRRQTYHEGNSQRGGHQAGSLRGRTLEGKVCGDESGQESGQGEEFSGTGARQVPEGKPQTDREGWQYKRRGAQGR